MIIDYDNELRMQTFLETGRVLASLGVQTDERLEDDRSYGLGVIEEPVVGFDHVNIAQLVNGQLIAGLLDHNSVPWITRYD